MGIGLLRILRFLPTHRENRLAKKTCCGLTHEGKKCCFESTIEVMPMPHHASRFMADGGMTVPLGSVCWMANRQNKATMGTPPLSLCMIVKNEATNLPRCLESVIGVADELVVLDTGSTDDTVAIAQSFQAQVHHYPWGNDFAAARNESLRYASGDWVLVLDADERLAPGIGPTLQQAMQQPNALLINLVRQEIGAAQSPYSLVSRLFRRHPAITFRRPYHAMVDDSVAALLLQEPQWQIGQLPPVAILHEGYQAGAIASRNKLEAARTTMEGFLATHPDDAYVCSKLGALYGQIGEVTRGKELLQRGLAACDAIPSPDYSIRYELHYHLGIAHSRQQHPELAAAHYRRAVQQPILPKLKLGAYNNWGNLLKASGDLAQAQAIYAQALEIDPDFATGHYNLGMTLKALGDLAGAIAHYQHSIRLQPDHADSHQNLGVVLLKLGRVPESLAAFGRAIGLHEQQQNQVEADRLRQGIRAMGLTI